MRAPRFAVQVPVQVSLDPAKDWVPARIVNLSASGALLELSSTVDVGNQLWFRSDDSQPAKGKTIACGVVVRAEPGTPAHIGIRLMD